MNIGIEVYVFCPENEDAVNQQEAGVPLKMEDCILVRHTVYNIDYVAPHDDNYCIISTGGEELIVNETYENINRIITESRIFGFN